MTFHIDCGDILHEWRDWWKVSKVCLTDLHCQNNAAVRWLCNYAIWNLRKEGARCINKSLLKKENKFLLHGKDGNGVEITDHQQRLDAFTAMWKSFVEFTALYQGVWFVSSCNTRSGVVLNSYNFAGLKMDPKIVSMCAVGWYPHGEEPPKAMTFRKVYIPLNNDTAFYFSSILNFILIFFFFFG